MPSSNVESEYIDKHRNLHTHLCVARDHIWLAYSWPKHLQFFDALDIPPADHFVESHETVPLTYSAQLAWAYIAKNRRERDHTRGLKLLYKNPPVYANSPADVMSPVGIRVQGFIERCNLKPLGSWIR
jgi:hypothetical protein